jgi:hypothetical protein
MDGSGAAPAALAPPSLRALRALAVAALLAAGLAGCSGKGPADGPSATGGPGPGPDGLGQAEGWPLPAWAVGDAWSYSFNGERTTYGITSQTSSDWIMDTDTESRAFADARDDVSRLGPQRKSDLAGSQGDERVEFFRWPLAENKTWETRWDHQPVVVRVTAVTADGAQLEARAPNGTLAYRYTYDSRAGWFGELHHFAPDGRELVGLRLEQAIHGWAGPGIRYALVSLYASEGTDTGHLDGKQLQPDAAATDVWIGYHLECSGVGGFTVSLQPVDPAGLPAATGQGHTLSGQCPPTVDWQGAAPGALSAPWTLGYDWGSQATSWRIEVLQRTRTEVPVTP